jgi:copper resistance protein C
VTLLPLLAATPAAAHSELLESTPAANATLSKAPTVVQLVFGESVQEQGGAIVVKGPDDSRYDRADTFATDENVATVRLTSGAPAGRYTVTFRVVSADGHVVGDSFSYRVSGAASQSPADDTAETPSTDASPVAGASEPANESGGSGTGVVWVLGLGAIGIVLVAAVISVAVRGRRDRSD